MDSRTLLLKRFGELRQDDDEESSKRIKTAMCAVIVATVINKVTLHFTVPNRLPPARCIKALPSYYRSPCEKSKEKHSECVNLCDIKTHRFLQRDQQNLLSVAPATFSQVEYRIFFISHHSNHCFIIGSW